ncbi:CRISPR type III-associated RAMP protein Csm4 [Koleobacter methoxysyntrophicus]|jgi:CRISPR-associated protein Csm4|uniref:CRISPR system Cms protein Csm4 n=1 Tax=Koleobacter methoxysyntrophicus TaxID=2751313 RepID=A0A8A0RK43_9FIRM|nr:type III-A CRISPR-associated RAMP protein Csm4 [Koleobacter methoxysyntrophicus]QSQ08593.1 CRISPR type III-associated RAMP protein Csm4 [Koleobacter methoxysyntrophicus]
MKNYIIKLKFTSPVRFGPDRAGAGLTLGNETCHSDTFFSALCIEWLKIFGEAEMNEMVRWAEAGHFILSSLLPWKGQELFLPKPVLFLEKSNTRKNEPAYGKTLKKLKWIPASAFDSYIRFLKEGGELPFSQEGNKAWSEVLIARAAIARDKETMPYVISAYRFPFGEAERHHQPKEPLPETGLYFILKIDSEELMDKLMIVLESLGLTGIGGKKTTGLGRFELAEEPIEFDSNSGLYDSDTALGKMLDRTGEFYMSLSVVAPSEEELEAFEPQESFYTLVYRSGFVESASYWPSPIKRRPVAMFGTGSCFKAPLCGRILDLSSGGNHPVYRYGKGMYLGVKI